MDEPAIRLVRPTQIEYIVVGRVLLQLGNSIYTMTEESFLKECMTKSNGSMNPQRVKAIFKELMEEAGI